VVSSWDFQGRVNLVLDYPIGFAREVLLMLQPPVVVVTACESGYYLSDLLEFQPAGLLIEPFDPPALEAALRLAASGHSAGYPEFMGDYRLPPRERQVLRLLAKGLSDKDIARELKIAPKSVSHAVLSLREKMGVENRAQEGLMYLGALKSNLQRDRQPK
jgi:DNA-binding NarL/FixJ family response regulator